MTTDKKTPEPGGAGNKGTKSIPAHSVTTAYLSKSGDNTRYAYGTWSGESVPQKGHITLIVDIDSVAQMMDDGPALVQINPDCVAKHDEHVQRYRAEQAEQERKRIRREIARRVEEEEFEEQLATIDAQATEVYRLIDKKVDAILEKEGKR